MKKKTKKYGKGGQALFDALKAKGYKKMGGEKLLVKMQMCGASMDMSDPLVDAMRGKKGKEIKKPMYKMGGWTSYKK